MEPARAELGCERWWRETPAPSPPGSSVRGSPLPLRHRASRIGFSQGSTRRGAAATRLRHIIHAVLRSHRAGFPRVAASAFVDESAQVIGDVEIGEDSSVWMNAVLRGDVNWIRVGDRTNIQDGSVLHGLREKHATRLGDEVTVGHGAILHGCEVEDRCLIGMGAIVLNGAVVGSGSIVAAGALVAEGTAIPPGSLVMGSPGRVRRATTGDEAASIRRYADSYVAYKREFQSGPQGPGE